MSSDKKKGDFDQWKREDVGGVKKSHAKGESVRRTALKENAGHGGH